MAANKIEIAGPDPLTTTLTTNLLAPAAAGASAVGYTATASYILIKHIHVANKTANAASFTLYVGASGANAAGTELFFGKIVPPNDAYDYYPHNLRLQGTNGFLVGGASINSALVMTSVIEIGLV